MKIHPVGAELFHADGRTNMTKLLVAFAILRTRLKRGGMMLERHVGTTAVLAQRSNSRGYRVCWPAGGVSSVIIYVFSARYEQKFVVSFDWSYFRASVYTNWTFLFLIQATFPTSHIVLDVKLIQGHYYVRQISFAISHRNTAVHVDSQLSGLCYCDKPSGMMYPVIFVRYNNDPIYRAWYALTHLRQSLRFSFFSQLIRSGSWKTIWPCTAKWKLSVPPNERGLYGRAFWVPSTLRHQSSPTWTHTANAPLVSHKNVSLLLVIDTHCNENVLWVRTAFLWVITQRVVSNPYRSFGKTYRSQL
jgi:hypothetical protein